ncbi:hypothetical protein QTN25_001113 [Entamoeba marina]
MKFVNKNFDFIFNDTFIKDLTNIAYEYALTSQKQFKNDMKNGFSISKTTDDAIETTINRNKLKGKLISNGKDSYGTRVIEYEYEIYFKREEQRYIGNIIDQFCNELNYDDVEIAHCAHDRMDGSTTVTYHCINFKSNKNH